MYPKQEKEWQGKREWQWVKSHYRNVIKPNFVHYLFKKFNDIRYELHIVR